MTVTSYEEMLAASNIIKKIADEAVRVGTKNVQGELPTTLKGRGF